MASTVEASAMVTQPQTLETAETRKPPIQYQASVVDRMAAFPWWGLAIALLGLLIFANFLTNATYNEIITTLVAGLFVTIYVTLIAYSIAIILGLLTALGQLTSTQYTDTSVFGTIKWLFRIVVHNLAVFYVQVVRGVPIIVQIFYVALVLIPIFAVPAVNWFGSLLASWGLLAPDNALATLSNREVNFVIRGIIALAIAYGAFSSEIFRAGIQSIGKGQIEAAKAIGLNWFQSMRLIILPQAIRVILPPLGNDFIAMLKESSLVSVIGVQEVTQLGKKYAAASFLYPQTYNTLAFLYLSMTLVLSMGVKLLERRLKRGREG